MSYTPTNWETGDTITAEKLNKLEQGVANAGGSGGGVLVVHTTYDEQTETSALDKTWQEIHDADFAVLKVENNGLVVCPVVVTFVNGDEYIVVLSEPATGAPLTFNMITYQANSADGYPVWVDV